MKTLEELMTTTSTGDIDNLIDQIIKSAVEMEARPEHIGRSLVNVETMPKGVDEMVFAQSGTIAAASAYVEGGTVTLTDLDVNAATLKLDKYIAGGISIGQKAIDDAKINLIKTGIAELGWSMIQDEDDQIFDAILDKTSVSGETVDVLSGDGTTITLDQSPLIVAPLTVGTASVVSYDMAAGIVVVGSSIATGSTISDYYYSGLTATDADVAGSLTFESIVEAQYVIKGKWFVPGIVVISPYGYKALLKSELFVKASFAGDSKALRQGSVGTISGMRVVTASKMPDGVALVMQKSKFTKMAARAPYTKRKGVPKTDSIEVYAFRRWGIKIINSGSAQLIVNLDSKSF